MRRLPRHTARRRFAVRGGGAGGHPFDRENSRIPRPLPRARRALSPIDGVGPEKLRLSELFTRVRGHEITEVVVATNPTMTGEATALFIAEELRADVQCGRVRVHASGRRPAGGRGPRVCGRG